MRDMAEHRVVAFLTRRQYGKTTFAAWVALKKMLERKGHTVVFGSVKLDLGREIVRKEGEILQRVIASLAAAMAAETKTLLQIVDAYNGKDLAGVKADDFAELYETSRLELRLYHDRTAYSRTKVVALTPDAVGETGDLILDEVGRVKKFREVWEAVKPIISSNPDFRCLLTTTPPPDDTHYSFELLAPPMAMEFPVNPAGNTYRSELGCFVRRVGIDATSERNFASDVRRELRAVLPVQLVIASERHEMPGTEPTSWKQWLGARLVSVAEDNHLVLPAARYVREDFRLVKRDRGSYVCEPDGQGRHGDTFDAVKLALEMLGGGTGMVRSAAAVNVGAWQGVVK